MKVLLSDDATGIPVVEPLAVPDIFVSGTDSVEHLAGDLVRITLYADQESVDGVKERVIVARIVRPKFNLAATFYEILKAADIHPLEYCSACLRGALKAQ